MKCIMRNKAQTVKKKIHVMDLGVDLGEYIADVCPNCGERYFSSRVVARMQKAQKKAGLWGLSSRAKIVKGKDAITIQVKKKVAKLLGLKPGHEVELESNDKDTFKVLTSPY